MAIASLTTLPTGTNRLGACTWRPTSTTVRQCKAEALAASAQGPQTFIGNSDFLIFGRSARISGVVSCFFAAVINATNEINCFLAADGNSITATWEYSGGARNATVTVNNTAPNSPYVGGSLMWAVQRDQDRWRVGYLDGHTLTMTWGSWVTSLAATLGVGADWNNYEASGNFYINASTSTNFFAAMYWGPVFVKTDGGGLDAAGLFDDADVAKLMLDPQRIFDAGRTGITGILSYGDYWSGGARVSPTAPRTIADGDLMKCPITGRTLTFRIGTNTGTGGIVVSQVLPDYTQPTVTSATASFGGDNNTRAEHYPGNIISGSVCIQPITIVATSSAKRTFGIAITNLSGQRVRPVIPVPMAWHYTDATAGPVYAKATSYWNQCTSSPDNHWHMTALIVNGSIVFHPTFHSEGYNTAGVVDTPATGDCGWGITQLLSYVDPTSFADAGFTLLTPQESGVDWAEAPGLSSTHQAAISSYSAPSMPISGDGAYDGAFITPVRNLLTSNGYTSAIWYKTGFGSTQNKQLTVSGGSTSAAIPVGTFDLGGGYFIVVVTPRYSGSGTFFGLHGFIGLNDANFTANANWWSPVNGEVLDGSGANAWTVGTLTTDNNEALNFGYPENDVSPLSDMKACTEYQINQTTGGYLCGMLAVGAATSVSTATPTFTQLIVRTWRFNAATKIMGIVDSVDIYDEVNTVLGTDPNIADAAEASRIEAGYVIQPTTGGGFVVWMRSREQTTLTNGTHYTDFPTRYGVRVIGMYFHDPADLSKRTWLYEADGTTLYEAWHVTDDGGLSCGPLPVSNGTSPASNYVAINVFVGVTSTATGMTIRPIVDASVPIARASSEFAVQGGIAARYMLLLD